VKARGRPQVTALLTLLILSSLVLLPVPLLECRVCRGIARRLQTQGVPQEEARRDCPSCRDGGRTTLLKGFRYRRTDSRLRAMIQEAPRTPGSPWTGGPVVESEFLTLLRRNGTRSLLLESRPTYNGRARFVEVGGLDFVVAIASQSGFSIPGDCRVEACLFDLRGNLLDRVEGVCSTREGSLAAAFVSDSPPVGPVIRIDGWDAFVRREYFGSFELSHGEKTSTVKPRGNWMAEGLLRLAVRDGKFEVLPPPSAGVQQ